MKVPQPDDDDDFESDVTLDPREKPMGFFDHLEDLRWTLVKSVGVFLVFAIIIGFALKQFNEALLWPLHVVKAENPGMVIDLGTTSLMEGFSIVVQICAVGGFVMAAPFILFFVGQFVAPALNERELKLVLPVCLAALILFLVGAAFSFFLLVPSAVRVAVQVNDYFGFVMRWTPGSYYNLLLWLVAGVGASFEFPLVIVVLVWLGLLTTAFLRKYRRHTIVLIFIIAAVVTPTPDPVTQTIFAIPLYILFEIAVFVSSRVEKARLRAAADLEGR